MTATSGVKALAVPHVAFMRVLDEEPAAARELLVLLCARLREAEAGSSPAHADASYRRPGWDNPPMPRTVLTFGTFDVFHVGHLRVIERAAAHGDRLVVGVSSDALNLSKKGREPVFSQGERLAIVAALKPVDEVFIEESLELKRHYIEQYAADVLVMGDDWAGKFDEFEDICEVVYLPRTPAISTTALIEKISDLT